MRRTPNDAKLASTQSLKLYLKTRTKENLLNNLGNEKHVKSQFSCEQFSFENAHELRATCVAYFCYLEKKFKFVVIYGPGEAPSLWSLISAAEPKTTKTKNY